MMNVVHCSILCTAAAVTLLGRTTLAGDVPWSPDWSMHIPVGSALTAGLQDMATTAEGVTFVTGVGGPSSDTNIYTTAVASDGSVLWQRIYDGSASLGDQGRGITHGEGLVYVTGNTPGPGNYANVLLLTYDAQTGADVTTTQYSSGSFTSEHGSCVEVDAAGNTYIAGGTVGDGADALVMSFDPDGDLRWSTSYDGPAWGPYSQDHVTDMAIDPSGDLVVVIDGVMNSLHSDYVVIKYDTTTGAAIWQTSWGLASDDYPQDLAIDAAGDIFVTGTGLDGPRKISTIKLRGGDGALLWQAYDTQGFRATATALSLDDAGHVYVTGASDPDGDQSNFNNDFLTVKRHGATGALVWTHVFGDGCVGCFDVPGDIIVDPDGNVLVVGESSSAPQSNDMMLFRLDSETGLEIERSVVDEPGGLVSGGGLRLDGDGAIYIGGEFGSPAVGEVEMAVFRYASLVADAIVGDVDGSGAVDIADLLALLAAWGRCTDCPADIDGNGVVDITDLLTLLSNWG